MKTARGLGWIMLLVVLIVAQARAGEPPTRPLLRLETGMHTAPIRRIAVDREERFLVTASHDKTARVWELTTGKLLATLRPPVGETADEGKLYAVAMAPDGATVAVAGWTKAGEGSHNIYLFDRASGRLLRRIPGLPNVIYHLAWSRDGRALAATLGGANGIRVHDPGNGRELFADKEYGTDSYWADFDPAGRLVTSSYDGFIRLYDASFRLLAKKPAPGGKKPFSVAFSPDGREVVVGFADTTAVALLAGNDLTFRHAPETRGVDNGTLNTVAWSRDGRALLAGGMYDDGSGMRPIRRWEDKGRGAFKDFPVSNNTLMDLRPLQGGQVAFGAQDPLWGVMDAQGKVIRRQGSGIADLRDYVQGFRLSQNGEEVAFWFENKNKRPARFNLAKRTLTAGDAPPGLAPPRLEAPGLEVKGWEDTLSPTLNGKPLSLRVNERSRSLAIAPGDEGFLLGASWTLYRFDREGEEVWATPLPAEAWAVNVSGDGRVAVAGLSDGTIRWYRMTDGQELAALFPHNDGQRWVLWTPEGFYDAGNGGEALIGFHLNQGKDHEGRFVGVDQLAEAFYRPDLVAQAIQGGHDKEIQEAARRVDVARLLAVGDPPRLHFAALPDTGEERPTVRLCLHDQGGGIGKITLRVNGAVVGTAEGRGIEPGTSDCPALLARAVPLQPGTNQVSATAYNKDNRIESRPAEVTLTRAVKEKPQPTLHILAVGIDAYRDKNLKLDLSVADALAVTQKLYERGKTLYRQVKLHAPVLNDQATRVGLGQAFARVAQEVSPDDVFVFFVAAHGMTVDARYYLIPQDLIYQNKDSVVDHGIGQEQLQEWFAGIPAQKSLLLLDTCDSGAVVENELKKKGSQKNRQGRGMEEKVALDMLMRATGRNTLTAATDQQTAWAGYNGHGIFTTALLSGMDGNANLYRDGNITVTELALYVGKEVPRIAKEAFGEEQFPLQNLIGMDFPLVMAP